MKSKETEMRAVTIMYIKMYKAIDANTEECCDLENSIVNTIEENLKFYEINKYDYVRTGATTTEALEYYIDELSKKYLGIDNIFKTPYWQFNRYIPLFNAQTQLDVEETMQNIKTEEKVKEFLDWYKEADGDISFNYHIIEEDEISDIIQKHNNGSIRMERQDFYYDFYNPIITWKFDGTLFIIDWVNLKSDMIGENWLDCLEEEFLEEFGIPTLDEYLEENYELHPEVRKELAKEVKEFYDIYKNDIIIIDDFAESINDNMMLVDAIWNHAPLFCNSTIENLVVKLYKKEIRL